MMTVLRIKLVLSAILLTTLPSFSQSKKIIGFLMDDFNSARWKHDSAHFAAKVRASGYEVMIRICDSDTALQHRQAKELIKAGAKVLVVVPATSTSAAAIVATSHENKVPVIAYDRLILNCDLDYFISFDGDKVGELQAQQILRLMYYHGNIMLMNGPEHDENSLLFKKGQMNVLQSYVNSGAVKIIYDKYLSEWTSMEAYMEANDFLSSYNGEVNGIIAANDEIAGGVIDALTVYKSDETIPLSGQDATADGCKNILNGKLSMTVYKPVDSLAFRAAELACRLAEKKQTTTKDTFFNGQKNVAYIKLSPVAINKENIQSLLINANTYVTEEIRK